LKKAKYVVAGLAVVVGATLTACSGFGSAKSQEPFKDGPKYPTHDRTPAKIIENPDGFSNLATKCVGGIWFTEAYKGDSNRASVTTVLDPAFPNCTHDFALQH